MTPGKLVAGRSDRVNRLDWCRRAIFTTSALGVVGLSACSGLQTVPPADLPRPVEADRITVPMPVEDVSAAGTKQPAGLPAVPRATGQGKPLPINLPTALQLSGSSPLDITIAGERVDVAAAQFDRARLLWLPNVNLGADYFRHDGQIQDVVGTVFTTSRSSVFVGARPQASVATAEAIYAPLAARQVLQATRADAQAVRNDATLAVAVAYFNVQQARGDVAGAVESLRRADDLVARTEKLAPDLTPFVEVNRAKTEAARRRQAVESAYERWQVASAELTRLLRLEPGTLVEPAEEPALAVTLIDPAATVEDLIAVALTHRPELTAYQSVVQAALARVRQEKARPFLPTLAVRGVGSTVPAIAGGYFGGGINDDMIRFGPRFSVDLQAVWEFQNLGFGNRAVVREREGESRRTLAELLRMQDLVSAEVVQAHAQLTRAARRRAAAEDGVANALATAEKNLEGLGQTKRVGDQLLLVFRPQEAVAAVSALDQAYRDFFQAVADHNRAQFRLYRALGHPAQALCYNPPAEDSMAPPQADPSPAK